MITIADAIGIGLTLVSGLGFAQALYVFHQERQLRKLKDLYAEDHEELQKLISDVAVHINLSRPKPQAKAESGYRDATCRSCGQPIGPHGHEFSERDC